MPVVERQDIDHLNAVLTVKVEHSDYASEVKTQLSTLRKRAKLKGFRPGKVPMSMVKKMYGKSVVFEAVNKVLQEEMNTVLDNFDRRILGQPLPFVGDDESPYDFNVNNKEPHVFKYKIGMMPQFELKGYSSETSLTKYDVYVPAETINEEIEKLQQRFGETSSPEEDIQPKDVLKLQLQELEGDAVKEGGVSVETTVAVDLLHENISGQVLAAKQGDVLTVNINELDTKMTDAADIKKLLLKIEDETVTYNEQFQATITEVMRVTPAAVDADLIEKAVPGNTEITDEAGLRTYMENDILKYFKGQSNSLLLAELQRSLLEQNELPLPDAFLKEWLASREEEGKKVDVEAEYDSLAKGLRWSFIRDAIAEKAEIKVEQSDIEESIMNEIKGYFGGSVDPSLLNSMMDKMMEDQEAINRQYEKLINDKVAEAAQSTITLIEERVTQDELNEVIKTYNEKNQEAEKSLDEALVEQVEEIVEAVAVEEEKTAE